MRYMNQHFGQSRIFGHCRFRAAMDSGETQTESYESNIDGGGAGNTQEAKSDVDGGGEGEPTVAELMAQVAQLQADSARQKNALDKAMRERGELSKQLKSRMTAQEQIDAAKKEAEEASQAELKELRNWKQVSEFVEECMDKAIGMDKATAKEFSEALVNGDSAKAFKALGNHIKALRAAWDKEVDARSPEARAGSGSAENDLPVELAKNIAKKTQPANQSGLDKWISGGRR